MRVLVTGWFSIDDGEITAGDMLACETVRGWLAAAGVPHDVAVIAEFRGDGDVGAQQVDPARYSHVLFVCGPVASPKVARLLKRSEDCRRIAVGVSMTPGGGHLLGWPAAPIVDEADVPGLAGLLDWCLSDEARARAAGCAQAGRRGLQQTHAELLELLGDGGARAPQPPAHGP